MAELRSSPGELWYWGSYGAGAVGPGARLFVTYYRRETAFKGSELEEAIKKRVGGDALYAAMQQQPGQTVVESIVGSGGVAVEHELNLGYTENAERVFDLCEERLGPADILINNQAHFQADTFIPTTTSEGPYGASTIEGKVMDQHFAVNVRSCASLMGECLCRHVEREADWGRIVNLTTALSHPGAVSYAASKRALVSYSMSAAEEMGRYGITVNVVCPGATETGYITPENEPDIVARTGCCLSMLAASRLMSPTKKTPSIQSWRLSLLCRGKGWRTTGSR